MYELPTAIKVVGSESVASVIGRPSRLINPIVQMSPMISAHIGSTAPQKLRNAKRKTPKQRSAPIGDSTSVSRNMLRMPRASTMGTPATKV